MTIRRWTMMGLGVLAIVGCAAAPGAPGVAPQPGEPGFGVLQNTRCTPAPEASPTPRPTVTVDPGVEG